MIERCRVGVVAGALAALIATAAYAGDEQFPRGVHQGRVYRLYVPPAPAAARPLVVALHGCSQTPEDFALGTRLNRAAGRRGLRVLYPAQGPFDNPARCWNWFAVQSQRPAGGETGEILTLVREVQHTQGATDPRVVVLGFSAGGYMAVNLACAAPDLVVGVGVSAGGPYHCADSAFGAVACMRGERLDGVAAAGRCTAVTGKAPTPRVALWHGDGDSVVNPANHTALVAMFTRLHGSPARIQTRLVPGMGHAWSGGDPRGTHTFPSGPDATESMLGFLVDQ